MTNKNSAGGSLLDTLAIAQAEEKMWYGWPDDHNPESTSTMTTSKQNNFAVDLADLERKLASNITSTLTAHVKRWNPPATQHNQSANKISKPNVVLAGEQQNTPGDVAVIPLRVNTLKNDSKIERVKCTIEVIRTCEMRTWMR